MVGMTAMAADNAEGVDRSMIGSNTKITGLDRRAIGAFTNLF